MSRFLKWIVNIILIVSILVACSLLVPPLVGVTTVVVDDINMVTNLERGSVTYAVEKGLSELAVGDNVLIQGEDSDYVYRLNSVEPASGSGEVEDVKSTDGQTKTEVFEDKAQKVIFTIPFIGYVVMAMKSTEGLIIIGLGVIFVIILFILSELWKKDKYEDEENEEDEGSKAQTTSVDMSAHILEKVSSEIGSEVSSIAQDTNPTANGIAVEGTTISIGAGATREVPVAKDKAETQEVFVAETEQAEKAQKTSANVTKAKPNVAISEQGVGNKEGREVAEEEATTDKTVELATEEVVEIIAEEAEGVMATEELIKELEESREKDAIEATTEANEELATDEEDIVDDDSRPTEVAMPAYTVAELIQKAKAAGYDPEVKRDDSTGITILDYSDIL